MRGMSGGKRPGAGRPAGTTKGRVKIGTTVSTENADWLEKMKLAGHEKARLIDKGLDKLREENE